VLKADTPGKMRRAIEMFIHGPGLELFVTVTDASGRLKQLAAECARQYFERRLRTEAAGDPIRLAKVEALIAGEFEAEDDHTQLLADLERLQAEMAAQQAELGLVDLGEFAAEMGQDGAAAADGADEADDQADDAQERMRA
jgi:hypothetical protein